MKVFTKFLKQKAKGITQNTANVGNRKKSTCMEFRYIKTSRPCAWTVTGGSDGLWLQRAPGSPLCCKGARSQRLGRQLSLQDPRTPRSGTAEGAQLAQELCLPLMTGGAQGNLKGCKPVQQLPQERG